MNTINHNAFDEKDLENWFASLRKIQSDDDFEVKKPCDNKIIIQPFSANKTFKPVSFKPLSFNENCIEKITVTS